MASKGGSQSAAEASLVNPHIPQFMSKAPWYLPGAGNTTLDHQRLKDEDAEEGKGKGWGFTSYYKRGQFAGQATRYRAGACKNCGAITHAEKDCVERPRARGAWKTGRDIAPDEMVAPAMDMGFDAKRDRYNGYDAEDHTRTIAKYAAAEIERKAMRAEMKAEAEAAAKAAKEAEKTARALARAAKKAARGAARAAKGNKAEATAPGSSAQDSSTAAPTSLAATTTATSAAANTPAATASNDDDDATASSAGSSTDSGSDSDSDSAFSTSSEEEEGDDEVRERGVESAAQSLAREKTQAKMSVRNLRVREDRAKYLINLDTESAFYDPKTRSMRENPLAPGEEASYTGDNAWRASGLVGEMAQMQQFAWDAAEQGAEVHLQANPTQLEFLKKQYGERKASLAASQLEKVRARYGDGEGIVDNSIPREVLYGQGEAYVEYGRDGKVRGAPVSAVSTGHLDEDVWPGNHTSVWGSWYDKSGGGRWGYACCHSTHYTAYCTGAEGLSALAESDALASGKPAPAVPAKTEPPAVSQKELYGEGDAGVAVDPKRMAAALERYEKAKIVSTSAGQGHNDPPGLAGHKRKFNSGGGGGAGGGSYHGLEGSEVSLTAEDMEVFRMKRSRAGDPMAEPTTR